jgi:hypothetical protein
MTEFQTPDEYGSANKLLPERPGFPQYDPASVTQVPEIENDPQLSSVAPVSYKPTFKPYIPGHIFRNICMDAKAGAVAAVAAVAALGSCDRCGSCGRCGRCGSCQLLHWLHW